MRWLAGRGFGVLALANITYAPMTELGQSMFEVLADHDALPPAALAAGPEVEALGRRLVDLLRDWDDDRATALFTDNVAMDVPLHRRRAEAQRWLDDCGGELRVQRVVVCSATDGRVAIEHPSGSTLWLELCVAPIGPPRVQQYELELR
jgi:hypothetical protein